MAVMYPLQPLVSMEVAPRWACRASILVIVGRFVYRGTQTGELMGIPASGHAVEMRSIDIWRVQDGMFVEHWDELNLLEVFQQVGALPPLRSGPGGDA